MKYYALLELYEVWNKLKILRSDRTIEKSLHSEAKKTPKLYGDVLTPFCLHASLFFQIESEKMSIELSGFAA